uniref:Uncharacterized protein n=1 Tax=viral metagenome TaxID=1070528 RepID=A0A6C0JB51_9ZZZZ
MSEMTRKNLRFFARKKRKNTKTQKNKSEIRV